MNTIENLLSSHKQALACVKAGIAEKKESHHAGTVGGDKVISGMEKDARELEAEIKRLESALAKEEKKK